MDAVSAEYQTRRNRITASQAGSDKPNPKITQIQCLEIQTPGFTHHPLVLTEVVGIRTLLSGNAEVSWTSSVGQCSAARIAH